MSWAPLAEIDVLVDEVLVDLAVLDDVVGDVVENRQVGLGREDRSERLPVQMSDARRWT